MEKNRQTKVISIIALVVAVIGMSVGFAAFSNTLTISSGATVTPNKDDFKVVLSGDENDHTVNILKPNAGTHNATGEDAIIINENGVSSTELKAAFTAPGQVVSYDIYIHNIGSYASYLNKLEFNNVQGTENKKVCTPLAGATPELVEAACENIHMYVNYNVDEDTKQVFRETKEFTGFKLEPNSVISGEIVISYYGGENAPRADGPFTVEFGDVKFYFSTVD